MINRVFRLGEIVRLNSGSPPLTVVESDLETVTVQWKQTASFPVPCVRREPQIKFWFLTTDGAATLKQDSTENPRKILHSGGLQAKS